MSPGDKTIAYIADALKNVRAEDAEAIKARERLERERASDRMGMALFALAALVFVLTVVAYIIAPERLSVGVVMGLAGFCVLLAFGGGALVQNVRLDRILTAWRKGGAS